MAIKTVGNQQVYVIEAQPVAAAKTSTGVGYANLVSQLRWQIWEQAQKAVQDQMGFEKLAYQAQLDSYAKQRQQLQASVLKIKTLKDKVANGDLTIAQAASLAKADASFDQGEANRKLRAAERVTSRNSQKDTLLGPETSTSTSYSGLKDDEGNPITIPSGGKRPSERVADLAGRGIGESKDSTETDDTDTYLQSLEAELASLEMPELSMDTNALSRTREAFGGMAGDGGFGFMPRPSKTSPIYDEARAREAIAAQAPANEQAIGMAASRNADDLRASMLASASARNKNRIAELQALRDFGGSEEELKALDEQILLLEQAPTLTSEQEANIARTSKDAAAQDFRAEALLAGPGERTAQSFMSKYEAPSPRPDNRPAPRDRDILSRMRESFVGVPGVDAAGFQYGGQGPSPGPSKERFESPAGSFLGPKGTTSRPPDLEDIVDGGEPPRASRAAPQPLPTTQPVRRNRDLDILAKMGESFVGIPGVDAAGFQYGGQGEVAPPKTPVTATEPPIAAQRVPSVTMAPEASAKDEDAKRADASTELYTFYAPRSIDLDTNEEKLKPLNNLEKKKIFDMWMAEEETTSTMSDEEGKAWYIEAIKKVQGPDERGGKVEPKTRQNKAAAYAIGIVKAGKVLADQPNKLARLAKLDLPQAERNKQVPEHILLVDKVYNVNKPRQDAYKLSFNEISRVYAKDEKRKKEALQYLSALQILESDA